MNWLPSFLSLGASLQAAAQVEIPLVREGRADLAHRKRIDQADLHGRFFQIDPHADGIGVTPWYRTGRSGFV